MNTEVGDWFKGKNAFLGDAKQKMGARRNTVELYLRNIKETQRNVKLVAMVRGELVDQQEIQMNQNLEELLEKRMIKFMGFMKPELEEIDKYCKLIDEV